MEEKTLSLIECDVLIIGAGAAGMMTAFEVGKQGFSVALLEHNDKVGEKIRISGGGHCNFTNLSIEAKNYISENPHFCKSAIARYTPYDFIEMLSEENIDYHERKWGQLFCDNSANEVVKMLLKRCKNVGVEIYTRCKIDRISKKEHFIVNTSMGTFSGKTLVVATGGLSIPKLGATGFGYRIAQQFGLSVTKRSPALVSFIIDDKKYNLFHDLQGVSLEVIVSCRGQSFRENLLFTHKGLSGPAILQISSYWKEGDTLSIDLLVGRSLDQDWRRDNARQLLPNALSRFLPKRFSQQWCKQFNYDKPLSQYNEKDLMLLEERLHHWEVKPLKTEGYKKAEVTVGGIDTKMLSSKTMEANDVKGLFFVGEVIDVTGWLGGYNFHWAWSSAHAAGTAITKMLNQ